MGLADGYFSLLAGVQLEVDDMKKGASWRDGGWFGGTDQALKGTDHVVWTVDQVNANNAKLKRAFAELMCVVVDTTGALDPSETLRRHEEYKVQAERATSEYEDSIARFKSHAPKRHRGGGVRHGCECTITKCGTRACKCVKNGDRCGPACHCSGGPNCHNILKHAEGSSSSSSSASSAVGPDYDSDPPRSERNFRTRQTARAPQVALFFLFVFSLSPCFFCLCLFVFS